MGALDETISAAKAVNAAEAIIRAFRGDPNSHLSNRRELRWGRKGSLSLSLAGTHAGRWADFEAGIGGDAIDFVTAETGQHFADAARWISQFLGTGRQATPFQRRGRPQPRRFEQGDEETLRKAQRAARIADEAQPIFDTRAERYLMNRLGGEVPADALASGSLRHHPTPYFGSERVLGAMGALVAIMRNPKTGEACGVQRTFVVEHSAKLTRRMLGRAGAVMLYRYEDLTDGLAICEGVETGLAVQARFGWRNVWCAMSAGGVASFPLLHGVEALTIFADHDDAGQRAANQCAMRWAAAGAEVKIATPPDAGTDFCDRTAA